MLTFNVVLTMMMMTRVLMSRVDVDDSGVNGVYSDRVESEEIMMTLVLTVVNNERWKSCFKYFSIMKLFHLQKPLSKWR